MSDIINRYEDQDTINMILNSEQYAKFIISENTLELLEDKCIKIMRNQKLEWKPLLIERLDFIRMYNKIYYYKKW